MIRERTLPAVMQWTPIGRAIVFFLAATSIWCLLAEFYGLCSMQVFTFAVLIPATAVLLGIAVADRQWGDGRLWRGVLIGGVAGFVAACAYDVFRLPFVFSQEWHLAGIVPPMKLFNVFPRFGAKILGEPLEQPSYSLAAHLVGWAYHFSNGITFGMMYTSMIGQPSKRNWWAAIALAVGLELAMLFTPYTQYFSIHMTGLFVGVTLTAHLVFGVALGWCAYVLRPMAERRLRPQV